MGGVKDIVPRAESVVLESQKLVLGVFPRFLLYIVQPCPLAAALLVLRGAWKCPDTPYCLPQALNFLLALGKTVLILWEAFPAHSAVSSHSNSILTFALEKLLFWGDLYDFICSYLGQDDELSRAGDLRWWDNRCANSCKMPWFLFGAPLCREPSVPELTCHREHGDTLPVINLNKSNRLPQMEVPNHIRRRFKSWWVQSSLLDYSTI